MSVFFGLGYFWKFHNFAYFVTIQVIIMQQILYADNKLLQYMLEFICDHKRLPQQKNKQLCDWLVVASDGFCEGDGLGAGKGNRLYM